jgi:curved DNA binding protein
MSGEKKEDIRDSSVVTKYQKAAEIANGAMELLIKSCEEGKNVVELCLLGDAYIEEKTGAVYNKGKIEKGIGFPTCISVNHVVGHFSPLPGESKTVLKNGDLIKIDLGVHIDGYATVAAHSFVLGASKEAPLTGKQADVLACAHAASECALRLMKVGNKNTQVTEMIAKVAADFGCNAVQGVLSHQMARFVIDGEKVIINRVDPEQKVDEFEFAPNEVYAVDIVMSTGEGKPKEIDERTTVYKRAVDTTYALKMKASRQIFSEINKKFPTFPFSIRALDEKIVRFGIVECYKHELVHAYPVLFEQEGEFVAHIKFTVLLFPGNTQRITNVFVDPASFNSTKHITSVALQELLQTSSAKKKNKKKNKKKTGATPAADATDATTSASADTLASASADTPAV